MEKIGQHCFVIVITFNQINMPTQMKPLQQITYVKI